MDTQQIEPSQEILELLSEIYKMKKNTTKLKTELKIKLQNISSIMDATIFRSSIKE